MVLKTRKRIALLLILIYLLSMTAVMTLFNISYHRENASEISQSLTRYFRLLSERKNETGAELRMEPDGAAPRDEGMPLPDEESYMETRQIETVLRTIEGLRRYKSTQRSGMSDEEALAVAEGILTQKKRSGVYQNWQYELSPWDDALMIAFTDVSHVLMRERAMLARSALPFEAVAYEKGVTLTMSVEPDIHILGDNTQLERLLGILTDNAIRHTERGGEVRVSLTADGRLSVRNQGEPIPEKERERIFS